ncbi:MAG: GtrA family protein [Pseudomonadota bacterium]
MKRTLGELIRFGLVGVLNTAVGGGVIFALHFGAGLGLVWANLLGYVAGLLCSFVLNNAWTFGGDGSWRAALRFLLAFGVSYGVNLGVLFGLIHLGLAVVPAQLAAMIAYTAVFFVLSKLFVFTRQESG